MSPKSTLLVALSVCASVCRGHDSGFQDLDGQTDRQTCLKKPVFTKAAGCSAVEGTSQAGTRIFWPAEGTSQAVTIF
jgi:hypothetical protein